MKATKFSVKLLAFVIMQCVVMLTGIVLFGSMPELVASATDNLQIVDYDSYTDSDTLINSTYTIRDYASLLHHSTVSWNKEIYNVTADDPIVQIVPKSLFATKGEYLHIGREYGFFVKTTADTYMPQIGASAIDQYNNNVEVLVFDITTNTDIKNIQTPDLITISVEPLFQYRYAYIDHRSDKFYSDDNKHQNQSFSLPYSIPDGTNYVVPKPLSMLSEKFDQTWNYFLKDISFSPILLNEQHLNEFDDGYTAFGDDGYFFTQFDYKYDGIVSKVSKKDSIALGLNVASVICGSVSLVPGPVGAIAGVLGLILSGAQTVNSIAIVKNNGDPAVGVSISNGEMTAINQFTTKEGQIANYRNQTTGNPRLTKNATFLIEGNDLDGNAWFGEGNHATGYFRVSHTEDWLTRLEREIALSVVDKDGNTYQEGAKSTYKYMINEPAYPTINLDKKEALTLLADGDNYFWFMPRYTSDYYFSFDDINSAEVYVSTGSADYKKASIDNDNYYCRMNADNAYKIKIHSANKARLNITLSPSQSVPNIAPKAEYMIKYSPSATGAYTLAPSNSGFLIKQAYHNSEFNTYDICSNINRTLNCKNFDAVLKSGESYYFVLANNTSAEADSALVATACDKTLKIGANANRRFIGGENYRYYKFELEGNPVNVNFNFKGTNVNNAVLFCVYNENGDSLSPTDAYAEGYLKLSNLSAGVYYIGVRVDSTISLTPQINTDSVRRVWKQRVNGVWQELDNNKVYELKRGETYYFSYWIDGTVILDYYAVARDEEKVKAVGNFSVNIALNADDMGEGYLEARKYIVDENTFMGFGEKLKIRTVFNLDKELKSFSIDYENKVQLNMAKPDLANYINYSIYIDANTSPSLLINNVDRVDINILQKLCEAKAKKAKLVLTNINIKTGPNHISNRNIPLSREYEINCMSSSDSSTAEISNELHLYNLRHLNGNANLANDIYLNYFRVWEPIPVWNYVLNGCFKSIKNQMIINVPDGNRLLFGFVATNNGSINLLTIDNVLMNDISSDTGGEMRFGAIAAINNGTIFFCMASGAIKVDRKPGCVGGIVGINNESGKIHSCLFGVTDGVENVLFNSGDVGGIVGRNFGGELFNAICQNTYVGCYVNKCGYSFGCIAGYSRGGSIKTSTVKNCTMDIRNTKLVSGYYPKMGFVIGHLAGNGVVSKFTITDCTYYYGKLTVGYRKYCYNGTNGCYGYIESGTIN